MGKSESAKECKRHPNHKFLPGVCPSCLRERLLQFHESSNSNTITAIHSFSSSSTSLSSSLPQSSEFFFSSGSPRRRRHRRNASELVTGSTETRLFGDKLKKSGSIGLEAGFYRAAANVGGGGKKKGGFWSKLLRPKNFYFRSQPKASREILG